MPIDFRFFDYFVASSLAGGQAVVRNALVICSPSIEPKSHKF